MHSPERREAIAVEITYAILPSAVLGIVVFVVAVVVAWMLGIRGDAWSVAMTVAFVAAVLVASARTIVVLVKARRRGL